jgi:hypothetical protein
MGSAAGLLTYSYLQNGGFSMLPFAASKSAGYIKVFGASYLAFMLGASFVANRFGDRRTFNYLFTNKGGIMKGSKPWDKEA